MSNWESAARAAGWLPPDEVKLKIWKARNLNGGNCRWCGSPRIPAGGRRVRPHRPSCRFYSGPLTHAVAAVHPGLLDYWCICSCGKHYPVHGENGERQDCPDAGIANRPPAEKDLLAA